MDRNQKRTIRLYGLCEGEEMTKPKKYTVITMQPVYYYLNVRAKDKLEAIQKAEKAGGSKFNFLHKGDWQNHEVKEVKA